VDFAPINAAGKAVTFLALSPQLGVRYSPMPRFTLKLAGFGGIYFGMMEAGTGIDPFFGGLLDASYLISPALSLGGGAAYKHMLSPEGAVYQGIGVNLGAQYHIGAGRKKADLKVNPQIFPFSPVHASTIHPPGA
jgi:hypothetical protein